MSTPGAGGKPDVEELVGRMATSQVLDLQGRQHLLGDYWSKAPTVTTFVRHFGCLFCHERVGDLVHAAPAIRGAGAKILVIGNGSVKQAESFARLKGLPRDGIEVLTDPDRQAYAAGGFERSFRAGFAFNATTREAYRRARNSGASLTGWFGDLRQLGGTLVIEPPAHALYFHRSRFPGDHANMSDVVACLR